MNWGQRGTGSRVVFCAFGWMRASSAIACNSAPALPVEPVALQLAQPIDASSAETKPADADPPTRQRAEEVRPLVVGWAKISASPTAEAERLNREGLVLHKQGDHEAAVAKFGASLVASPGFAWGRYNNACALSRLGRTQESAALMEVLLLEDLPRFRARFLADEDLSALRGSPEGVRLNASLPKIAKAYGQVLARGVRAYAFESRAGWTGEEPGADPDVGRGGPQIPYKRLRIGLYDHETSRFVPMVPARRNAYSGLISREFKQAVIFAGWAASGRRSAGRTRTSRASKILPRRSRCNERRCRSSGRPGSRSIGVPRLGS